MRDLFRAFERNRVQVLLIGGQAAVLYGAAHFTQDVDLWVRPDATNLRGLLRSLAKLDARVHKLTPPVTLGYARRGHGFHFVLPDPGRLPAYLDVLGRPPRAGPWQVAARRARSIATPWGVLRVVAPPDLAEMKKTNRPADYEVISRLARIRLAEEVAPGIRLLAWALENSFRAEDVAAIWDEYAGDRLAEAARRVPDFATILGALRVDKAIPSAHLERVAGRIARRMTRLLRLGREYWIPRIRELRTLRARGGLIPEGTLVAGLLSRSGRGGR